MADLADGESTTMQGSAKEPYVLSNDAGAYSCTCPAWRHQSRPIDLRTCKHLKKLRGAEAEAERVGAAAAAGPVKASKASDADKPPLLLAHVWEAHEDPTGWWMSEKLDGVRAYWNGEDFVSRLGNVYRAPKWFVEGLPAHPLDGELWVARGEFQKTVSIVRRAKGDKKWEQVRYLVFDAPAQDDPFEKRLEAVEALVSSDDIPYASLVDHAPCQGEDHLREELERVEGLGGEGLMLRKPGSRYVSGRSTTLLKVKSFLDAEGCVIGHSPGKGKHKGTVGALRLVTADGIEFSVGTGLKDAERRDPPPIGSVVTFRYQEVTKKGVPRFPTFVRVREDVTWPPSGVAVAVPAVKKTPAKKKTATKNPPAKKTPAKTTTATSPAGSATLVDGQPAMFEFDDGKSSKFWEITLEGPGFTVRFGRQGATGRTQPTKTFADAATARAEAEKLVGQKTGKGYVPV